jgi:cytosine deaminase
MACSSLAFQTPADLEKTLALVAEARVTVVSLPLVNEWTQDRSDCPNRTPRWRGITTLHELRDAGVKVCTLSAPCLQSRYLNAEI